MERNCTNWSETEPRDSPQSQLQVTHSTSVLNIDDIGAQAAPAQAAGAPVKEKVKEEKKEEEAADVDMGGLFGDDYWAMLFDSLFNANYGVSNNIFVHNPLFYLLT